jgi:hypothetical protein
VRHCRDQRFIQKLKLLFGIYQQHKMKTRKSNIIPILILAVVAILICLTQFFYFKNLSPQPALPQKYEAYQELKFGKYGLFTISPFYADYYDSIHNQFISVSENNFYKIDADGTTIDSLKLNKDLELDYQSGYLLHLNFYYDWILTGDTTKHKYANIDSKNITTNQDLAIITKRLCNQATATHTFYGDFAFAKDSSELLHKYLFLINNKWQKLSVNHNLDNVMSFDAYNKSHDDRIKYFRVVDDNLALIEPYTAANFSEDKSIAKIAYNVAYFDKKKHYGAVSGTMNNDHNAFWDGVAYINYAYGIDTLKFKTEYAELIDKNDWASWVKYERCPEIFANKNVNFIIMNFIRMDGKLGCIMIKKNKPIE